MKSYITTDDYGICKCGATSLITIGGLTVFFSN